MIQISEPITLEKLLPLIQKLPKIEREQLRKSLEEESQLDAAILLYQEGEVTLGRAAELAGIHRFEFEEALAARGIWKIVEVDSAEALKEGVSLIKSLHKSNFTNQTLTQKGSNLDSTFSDDIVALQTQGQIRTYHTTLADQEFMSYIPNN